MRLSFVLNLLLLLVSSLLHKAWAQVVAPASGGYVKLEAIAATTMQVSFGGKGQGRVIAIAVSPRGYPVPLAAVDNATYIANASYGKGSTLGKGFAVYNGQGNAITITGLQPDTNYYITDSEYNSDGQAIAYNTQGTSMTVTTRAMDATIATPLPVELISFTGTVNTANIAALRWATASERNSSYFAIERSTNNENFTEVGRINASGTSFKELTYTWSDKQPLPTTTYYRLRQVDLDAAVQYSNVIVLAPQKQSVQQAIEVYPNPGTNQTLQISLQGYNEQLLSLSLLDNLGRVVYANNVIPASNFYLSPLALPCSIKAGTYTLSVTSAAHHIQKRLIINE